MEHDITRKTPVIAGCVWKQDENTPHVIIYAGERRKRILSQLESRIWGLIDGKRSVGDIIAEIGEDKLGEIIEIFNKTILLFLEKLFSTFLR